MRAVKPIERGGPERGSAIVEAALVFLVLFLLLLGILDFGQFLYIHQALTERARAGARYGIVNNPADATSIQNVVLYGQASGGAVPAEAQSTDIGIFNVPRSSVIVTATGSGTDDYRLSVQIQNYKYIIFSPLIAGNYTGPNILATHPLGANY
jgi:Flp pilus assembly protein TadG